MGPIIALTDLSANHSSLLFAAWLSQKLNKSLLLVHVYTLPVSLNDATLPLPLIPFAEVQESVAHQMQKIKDTLKESFTGLDIKAESILGDLISEVKELAQLLNPFAIIMGARGEKGSDWIFGNTIMAVIRRIKHAVLVVPDTYKHFNLDKIVLASDLDNTKTPVKKIMDVVHQLKAQLHVVHVHDKMEEGTEPNELINRLQEIKPVYHSLQDEDVTHGVHEYIQQSDADMLMVLPHEHSLLERFFFKLHTKELINTSTIPVFCIHE